jgi:tetratricopeptide (TPR) repeat protein
MDSLITAAARALATGNPLNALNFIALRDDAPALALRGIAMAQLGDLSRAKTLLRRAARAFSPREAVAGARCVVAEAEIALVSRDLNWPVKALDTAHDALERRGDRANAAHARYLKTRYLLLIGRLDEAERLLVGFDPTPLPPASRAAHELVVAGIAMRRLRIKAASAALARAESAARQARIPPLLAEVESATLVLDTPAARLIARGKERLLRLGDIETLLVSKALVVDACRPLAPRRASDVTVLAPPTDEAHATVLALLADGEAWSSSALALALGASQRTVQRALDDLTTDGKVQTIGRGRARRWMTPPVPGFPTTLLLPAALPGG